MMNPNGVEGKPDMSKAAAASRARRARRLDLDSGGDDRWKDRILIFGAVFVRAIHRLYFFYVLPTEISIPDCHRVYSTDDDY